MGIFDGCTDLEPIEFKVPMVCLVTGASRDIEMHVIIRLKRHC